MNVITDWKNLRRLYDEINCRRKLTIFQGVRAKNIRKYSIMFVSLAARLPSRFWKPMIQSLQKVAIKSIIGEKGNEKPVSKRYMAK